MDCLVRDNAAGVMQGCHYTGANIFHPRPHLGAVQADAAHMQPTHPDPLLLTPRGEQMRRNHHISVDFQYGWQGKLKEAGWKRHGGLIIC